jgi:hypothetical protein
MNKKSITRFLSNLPGWRTNKKIIVIESDDWGSSRFPNLETVEIFKNRGYNVDKCGFSRYDCLETNDDLDSMIQLLQRVKDKFNKKICITLLCNTSNPNYELIKESNFNHYYGEIFSDTIKNDFKRKEIINLLKKGKKLGFLEMQYHGREHLNVNRWMRALQQNQPETLFAFENKVCGQSPSYMPDLKYSFRAAYDLEKVEDLVCQRERLLAGIEEFNELYGYYPSYFVAPDGPFHKNHEIEIGKANIAYIGMQKIQRMPMGNGKFIHRFHWLGKNLTSGLCIITRNVIFEPMSVISGNIELVMNDIAIAFTLNKPAIISSHRANYVEGIDKNNREKGLEKLELLLESIIKRWPDVEFMSSSELGMKITRKHEGKN